MRKMAVMALIAAGMLCFSPAAWADDQPTGIWRMADGKVTVRISPCGAKLCATVVALKKPRDDKGRPRLDKENPNPALRTRPVLGLTILSGMRPAGNNLWIGIIYNPDDGNTYSSNMRLQNSGAMRVQGCVAYVLCKSMTFVRVN